MKTLILTFFLFWASFPSFSDDAYTKAMKKNLQLLQQAQTVEELSAVANTFERIASMAGEEWLPPYYCAYANLRISHLQQKADVKDAYLDKAQTHLDKAILLEKDNSEITALQGFILMMKVSIDPATRGQTLAGKVTATFEKAVKQDKENPRANYLLGNWAYGTAQFFKADTTEPCEMIKNSVELFNADQPEELNPQWGKEMALGMLKYCE